MPQRREDAERKGAEEETNRLSHKVIGAAIAIHKEVGPGLLESVYEECMYVELQALGVPFRSQVELPLRYRGVPLPSRLRLDMVIDEKIIVELKAVEATCPVHVAQLLTYLRATGLTLGLLINFNTETLTKGVRRVVLGFPGS